MKTIIKFIFSAAVCATLGTFISCTNYLDVSDELEASLDLEEVFNNPNYTRRWHSGLFSRVPNYSDLGILWDNPFSNPWNHMAGEALSRNPSIMTGGYNASTALHHRWTGIYQSIRDILLFLENVKPLGFENDRDKLTRSDVERMVAEAKFLLAYYYFLLFEQYGPVPIVDHVDDPSNKDIDYARASVDELVNYIDGLLQEVIESGNLPSSVIMDRDAAEESAKYNLNEIFRPTQTTALALRAKLWVYAASPLYNGGYAEALQLVDKSGKRLFPDQDPSKWQTAKTHLEALFRDAEIKGHKIYKVYDDESRQIDADLSIYQLFQYYNDEILWARGDSMYNTNQMQERNTDPRDVYYGWAAVSPSQNSVDLFFCKDGLSISESPLYDETQLVSVMNPCNENKRVDNNVWSAYANREPRFYASVTYQEKSWHIQPENKPDYQSGFAKGGGCDNSNGDYAYSGYLLYKFKNRRVLNTATEVSNRIRGWGRPSILFRLADFYLYYAEVCNEIDPGDPNIIKYIDEIRERAGIPGYQQLADQGIKNIIGDQEKQRKAIQLERHNELFAEGQRYFDIRRWMICDEGQDAQQSTVYSLDLNGTTSVPIGQQGSFYRRVVLENRPWTKAMYLHPIPFSEIQKSSLLVQNPLWN